VGGSGNVFIGPQAANSSAYSNVSNALIIANNTTSNLVNGNFATRRFGINLPVGFDPAYTLDVSGQFRLMGNEAVAIFSTNSNSLIISNASNSNLIRANFSNGQVGINLSGSPNFTLDVGGTFNKIVANEFMWNITNRVTSNNAWSNIVYGTLNVSSDYLTYTPSTLSGDRITIQRNGFYAINWSAIITADAFASVWKNTTSNIGIGISNNGYFSNRLVHNFFGGEAQQTMAGTFYLQSNETLTFASTVTPGSGTIVRIYLVAAT
jgi:hypothetical protein